MEYVFDDRVYNEPYAPFYNKYKGHRFIVDHYHPDDDSKEHVWLTCTTDAQVEVDGYVHFEDLVQS